MLLLCKSRFLFSLSLSRRSLMCVARTSRKEASKVTMPCALLKKQRTLYTHVREKDPLKGHTNT